MNKYVYGFNDECFYGTFDSEEEAIVEMKNAATNEEFGYVGIATMCDMDDVIKYLPDSAQIIEMFGENLHDNFNIYGSEWAGDLQGLEKLDKHLKKAFIDWLKETEQEPSWFTVYSHEKVELEEERDEA